MEHASSFEQQTNTNTVSSLDDLNLLIVGLRRRIDLATVQKKVDLIVKNATIVIVFSRQIQNKV